MEEIIKIEGGHPLRGTVRISGSKNSTVALIPACVLANEPVTIYGVPNISDVESLKVLLEELDVDVKQCDEETLYIDPSQMNNKPMVSQAVSKLRASYYFMGALLGKFGHVEIKMPGGCYLGPRPIDLHLKGFEALGATVQYTKGCYILDAKELVGTNIFLDISSVGATINIMMAAVYAKGRTVIENAAREPEIIDIADFYGKFRREIARYTLCDGYIRPTRKRNLGKLCNIFVDFRANGCAVYRIVKRARSKITRNIFEGINQNPVQNQPDLTSHSYDLQIYAVFQIGRIGNIQSLFAAVAAHINILFKATAF